MVVMFFCLMILKRWMHLARYRSLELYRNILYTVYLTAWRTDHWKTGDEVWTEPLNPVEIEDVFLIPGGKE